MTRIPKTNPATCKHPATRIYSWFTYDCRVEDYVLNAGCCDCGKVLVGDDTFYTIRNSKPQKKGLK